MLIFYLSTLVSTSMTRIYDTNSHRTIGDLHDGAGLSDAALPNGVLSNPIFEEIDYDILSIGKFLEIIKRIRSQ